MPARETARGLLDLARPVNAVAAAVLTATGAFVAVGVPDRPWPAAAAAGATLLAVAAGNAVNDYFDREIDAINRPDRPLPRGAVAPRTALSFAAVLFVVAVGLALSLPAAAVAIAGVNLLALVAYTEVFKGLPGVGNAVVAYLGGSTFLFGGAAVGHAAATGVLFALAALSTFTREVIKDVEDAAGDDAEGLTTLPLAVGSDRAMAVGLVVLAVAVAASPVPFVLGTFGAAYLALVVPADAVMLYAAVEGFDDPRAGQQHMKYGMFLAGLSFVVGRLAVATP